MRILFALPGFHRHERGAEIALISIARKLADFGHRVTLMGAGDSRADSKYAFIKIPCIDRTKFERFPSVPVFRSEYVYEELTFAIGLLSRFVPSDYDVTITCSYPFTNWILRRRGDLSKKRPAHVYVTQNGDWPARSNSFEYRFFGCDGLVCTNPDYLETSKGTWNCRLIPNGVDLARFAPGSGDRSRFILPDGKLVVLMVSALIPSKRVEVGIHAVSKLSDAHLVVAGDGPLRASIDDLARHLLPNRFTRLTLAASEMPLLYRSANVFLHLSMEESFGNVFVEALATGLPIVGHDSNRLRWIVGNDELLVDTNDVGAIARALDLAREQSPKKGMARREKAQRFSWENVGSEYEKFLCELTGVGPGRSKARGEYDVR